MDKAIIFDFNRTLFDPDSDSLMPGTNELLKSLNIRGIPLFLVCKGNEERRKKINELDLDRFFKKVIVTEKKEAENFIECCESEPDKKFFVVGDRLNEELRHGQNCGMQTIWFRNGKFADEIPEDITPNYTITSLLELNDPHFFPF